MELKNHVMHARQNTVGVTLIELITVIAVMAILISVMVPEFRGLLVRNRLKAATETMYSDLQFAKTEAIKRNKRIRVNFITSNGGATWCYGMKENADCDCNADSGVNMCHIDNVMKVRRSSDFPDVSILTSISSPGDRFTFESVRGIMDSTFGNIRFNSLTQKQTKVIVSRIGRIRICSPSGDTNVAGYPPC